MSAKDYIILLLIGFFSGTIVSKYIVVILDKLFGSRIYFHNQILMFPLALLIATIMVFLMGIGWFKLTEENKYIFVALLGSLSGIPFYLCKD